MSGLQRKIYSIVTLSQYFKEQKKSIDSDISKSEQTKIMKRAVEKGF